MRPLKKSSWPAELEVVEDLPDAIHTTDELDSRAFSDTIVSAVSEAAGLPDGDVVFKEIKSITDGASASSSSASASVSSAIEGKQGQAMNTRAMAPKTITIDIEAYDADYGE